MTTASATTEDRELMLAALEEARRAIEHRDVPIGAVIVDRDGEIVAKAHNEREARNDPTAHAEILALRTAASAAGGWRLGGHTMFVTIEPCPMCAGALVNARIDRVVFGAPDPKAGACGSLYNLSSDPRLNHEFEVVGGVLADKCSGLVEEFFADRR